jgi:hypothetical protein
VIAPLGGKATILRDFRVDEEPGMHSVFDLRLAPKGGQAHGQLQLVDRIVKMQKEKVNSLKQGEGAGGEF